MFSYTKNGIVLSEAAVPASPPTISARFFIDYGLGITEGPARLATAPVSTNTGFAIVNPANKTAHVTYTLSNMQGQLLATGHGNLDPGSHHAKFIDQMQELASDFILPAGFSQTMRFGSLQIDSDQALSITALRMLTNQRCDILYTSLPIADLTQSPSSSEIYFPHLGDGGGYTTSLILLNTSGATQTGKLRFYADDGSPLSVGSLNGGTDSAFNYSIPAGGTYLLQTDGFPAVVQVGSARLTPDAGSTAPVGAGIFSYTNNGYLMTETGIPSSAATTHARVFVDMTGNHDAGLAIAAIGSLPLSIKLQAYQSDGITPAGDKSATQDLAGNGHKARFAWEWISGLPSGFRGVLDISSATPFAALTLRTLTNQRSDYLLTTLPVADMTRSAPAPLIFPHLADGGGYQTEWILLGTGNAARILMNFFGPDGSPLAIAR